MRDVSTRITLASVVIIATIGIFHFGLAGDNDPGKQSFADMEGVESSVVAVARGDIHSVLTLNAKVVSRPQYQLSAPQRGIFTPYVGPGERVNGGDVIATVGEREIVVPVDGVVVEVKEPDGISVASGISVFDMQAFGFALEGQVAESDRYRLLDSDSYSEGRGLIDKGPGGFDCRLLGGPYVSVESETVITCSVADDIRMFDGLTGLLAINTSSVHGVLTLPLSSISGSSDYGAVSIVMEDGSLEYREVELGATDGSRIEVRSGLGEGDKVSLNPPDLKAGLTG
ncbi:hypothetical protein [Streptomyces sp. enrichment culture]|uniref:hypothetical protein n=1 Tax=Streptomyces sp. enrichment culture TaxID=1795815 RepID=UPI003F55FCE7